MDLTVESLMVRYSLDRTKAEEIFEKTAAMCSKIEKDPKLKKKALSIKKAALSEPNKAMLLHIAGGVAGAATGALVMSGMDGLAAAKNRIMRNSNIKQMQEAHPDLRNYAPKDLHLAYNTLARVAPGIASDPLLGGQFVKYVVGRNDVPVDMLGNLSKMSPQRNPQIQSMVGSTIAQSIARAPEVGDKMRWAIEQSQQREADAKLKVEQNARQATEHGWKVTDRPADLELEKIKLEDARANSFSEHGLVNDILNPNLDETPAILQARANIEKNRTVTDPAYGYGNAFAQEQGKIRAHEDAYQKIRQEVEDEWLRTHP